MTSSGGDTPALDLAAHGVADLQADEWAQILVPGEDMKLSWEPEDGAQAGGRIRIQMDTGWHGSASLTSIVCETADDGELTIPAELTELFAIPSCGECEMSTFARVTRDWVDLGAGVVELRVSSERIWVPWWGEW